VKVGLIGLGNVGTAIANLIASNGYRVLGWEYHEAVVTEINTQQVNTRFLAGVKLNPDLTATTNLDEVVAQSDVLFLGIPSLFIRKTLEPVSNRIPDRTILVNLAKGVDQETGLTAFQTLSVLLPHHHRMMLAGPAIANEFARGMPTVVVLAGSPLPDQLQVARLLDNPYFRTRLSDDAIGVELGGILKNIYTIGLGLFDGRRITSVNFRSVYLTIALEEITRIGVALGGRAETFAYLAGLGDLLATSLSEHSHNRRMGELLAEGHTLDKVKEVMGVVPEGYNTMKFALSIAEKLHVPLPLAKGLWDVIHGTSSTERFIYSFTKDFVEQGGHL
jgi:glycerol-3-phosphate dehydrogenase (NAD(P)+)